MANHLAGNINTDIARTGAADQAGVVTAIALDDPRLEPFVLNHSKALVFHQPAYLRTLEEESGQKCVCLASQDNDGRLAAILPLFYTRGLPFNIGSHQTRRRLCSLPRTPVGGVLSDTTADTKRLLQEAIRLARGELSVQLQIKTTEVLPASQTGLIGTAWRPTYVLTLPQSGDWLQSVNARTRHNIKWAVNKAIKLGVTIREAADEEDLRAWYDLYLCTMRRNVALPRPYKYFQAAWRYLRPTGLMRLSIAEMNSARGKVMVGGSIFLMSGTTMFYSFTGYSSKYATTHANDLVLWHAIERAAREAYRYVDFGEVAESHPQLVQYKKKWGCEPKPLYRYYCPAPRLSNPSSQLGFLQKLARRSWQTAPLPVTRMVGECINRYL